MKFLCRRLFTQEKKVNKIECIVYLLRVECGEYDAREERSIEKRRSGRSGTPEGVNVVCECSGRRIFTGPGIRTATESLL